MSSVTRIISLSKESCGLTTDKGVLISAEIVRSVNTMSFHVSCTFNPDATRASTSARNASNEIFVGRPCINLPPRCSHPVPTAITGLPDGSERPDARGQIASESIVNCVHGCCRCVDVRKINSEWRPFRVLKARGNEVRDDAVHERCDGVANNEVSTIVIQLRGCLRETIVVRLRLVDSLLSWSPKLGSATYVFAHSLLRFVLHVCVRFLFYQQQRRHFILVK
ncbi:hypothetical protein C7974DRAFT_39965 [Boeremia exigua]|uniref:uncharacterized protein n=1 Tax=Boeremia exigua TaxID=749465 RepID=UPI001E8CB415|nr:uncharacterized protein C7974DRAFT_39965 [Boeremia exigua]KAH6618964.1 hypothetical protein C7974DRAFT_39965 [Boeremia exigua]